MHALLFQFVFAYGAAMPVFSSGVKPAAIVRSIIPLGFAMVLLWGCASLPGQSNYRTSVTWNDSSWCVPWSLKRVLKRVSREYGAVTVYSTHRWPMENKLKGGKPKSYHLRCRAVDFAVSSFDGDLTHYLKAQPEVGGYSRYPQGFYHIDNGPRRTW
jgi:hypothetical protein